MRVHTTTVYKRVISRTVQDDFNVPFAEAVQNQRDCLVSSCTTRCFESRIITRSTSLATQSTFQVLPTVMKQLSKERALCLAT